MGVDLEELVVAFFWNFIRFRHLCNVSGAGETVLTGESPEHA